MTSDQIQSIIDNFDLQADYFIWQGKNATPDMDDDARLQAYYSTELLDVASQYEDDEKILALMENTGYDWYSAEAAIDTKYKVFTDEEADKAYTAGIDTNLDDIIDQIPKHLQQYFDREAYIFDNISDRGSLLNSYDGCEYEETINGTTYYIYKQ